MKITNHKSQLPNNTQISRPKQNRLWSLGFGYWILFVICNLVIGISAVSAAILPNDPLYHEQWYLRTISAPDAWDITTGDKKVIVAVIDSGFNIDHPDFKNNLWVNPKETPNNGIDDDANGYVDDIHGWNFIDANNNLNPAIDKGFTEYKAITHHGSLVAGIIGAQGNNAEGITGINWQVSIMALKALDAQGSSEASRVARAMEYAMAHGASIINMSFVGTGNVGESFREVLKTAAVKNIIVVAASGNDKQGSGIDLGVTPYYPICFENEGKEIVVGVTALDQQDQKARFANFGSTCVDIAAPGKGIYGAQYSNSNDADFQTPYGGLWQGTSLAAPVVSGVLALMKGVAPTLPASQLIQILLDNIDLIEPQNPQYIGKLGRGRVNAAKALAALKALLPPPVSLQNFTLNNSVAATTTLDTNVNIAATNTTTLQITNGNPLASPICNFTNVTSLPYTSTIPWRLAEGQPGERVVCLKLEGVESVYRSIFYLPELSKVEKASVPEFVRDIAFEKRMAPQALKVFKALTGGKPNFKNAKHTRAWHTLIYDLKYPRNLAKEQQTLKKFVQRFKRLPKKPLDWSAVHVLAYVL